MDSILSTASRPLSITTFLLASVLIVLIMMGASATLIPIVIAIGIWLVLNDITSFIHRVKIAGFQLPRPLAMILGLVAISLLTLRVTGILVRNMADFSLTLPAYIENLNALLNTIPQAVWVVLLGENADLSVTMVDQLFIYATDFLTAYVSTVVAGAASLTGNAIYIAVYVIFLLWEQGTFATKVRNMFRGNQRREEFQLIVDSIHTQVQTYLTVKSIVSLIAGAISYGIMVLFGLNHAIVWAILIFILNFIPNIGSIIALLFPIMMGLLQFADLAAVSALGAALGLVQVAVGYFVEPRMMGNQLNLSPFVVLVALGVFGAIWGIVGMFLSVPLTVILMIAFSHFDSTRPLAVLLSGDGVVHGIEEETEGATAS